MSYDITNGVVSSGIELKGKDMNVYNGGIVNQIYTVGGTLYVKDGGTANDTTVYLGSAVVSDGGVANGAEVFNNGNLQITNGGVVNNVEIDKAGYSTINNGGIMNNSIIGEYGNLMILDGGIHKGIMQISASAKVTAEAGSEINFTIDGRTSADDYMINDISLIGGAPSFSVTVGADQAPGVYKLAQSSAAFTSDITIGNGSIGVGESLSYNGVQYTLSQDGNYSLSLSAVVVVPSGIVKNDYNGDGRTDLCVMRRANMPDANGVYKDQKLFIATFLDANGQHTDSYRRAADNFAGWESLGIGDITGDGKTDVLWRWKDTGELYAWCSESDIGDNGNDYIYNTVDNNTLWMTDDWHYIGTGDVNGDGETEMLFQHLGTTDIAASRWVAALTLKVDDYNGSRKMQLEMGANGKLTEIAWVSEDYTFAGTGDVNADGKDDILWKNASGNLVYTDSSQIGTSVRTEITSIESGWDFAGIGDFNGDGYDDVLLQSAADSSGVRTLKILENQKNGHWNGFDLCTLQSGAEVAYIEDPDESMPNQHTVFQIGDFDGNGIEDICVQLADGSFDVLLRGSESNSSTIIGHMSVPAISSI